MKLPELSESAAPEFSDAASCKSWLDNVPLANVGAAQAGLLEQLRELNRFPVAAGARLAVMEALREAVNFVQIEQAKRFANRALPMSESELAAFNSTIALWDQMALGYQRCLDAALNRDAGMSAQAALICQRLLAYLGLRMYHHYRAYRQVPPGDWHAVHQAYAAAEKLDVAEDPVKDFLNRDIQDTSPRIAYARAVLMGMCNPNELMQRQLTFIARLLERWASKLEVVGTPVLEAEGVPPLVADLESSACPERTEPSSAREPRYLDARKLAKSLRNRVALLRKGESPAKLALGEDCVQPACEQLLVYLYRHWCQPKASRGLERRAAERGAEACSELAGVYYFLSGRLLQGAPVEQIELTQQQRKEMETFGRVITRTEVATSEPPAYLLEKWQIEEESAQGLRLLRRATEPGRRLAHSQLVGVRPEDAKQFMLCQVRWLMGAENGDLLAGMKLLPGLPSPLAVRATGLNVQESAWTPSLSLPAVAALETPASLVLPPGWYKPKRVIEMDDETPVKVRLTEILERGLDYERVAYEKAQ